MDKDSEKRLIYVLRQCGSITIYKRLPNDDLALVIDENVGVLLEEWGLTDWELNAVCEMRRLWEKQNAIMFSPLFKSKEGALR